MHLSKDWIWNQKLLQTFLFVKWNYLLTEIIKWINNPVLKEFGVFFIVFVKELNYPKEYSIHCDSIDKQENLFNGKRSEILDFLEVKRRRALTWKVACVKPSNEFRDISAGDSMNRVTLPVSDYNTCINNW